MSSRGQIIPNSESECNEWVKMSQVKINAKKKKKEIRLMNTLVIQMRKDKK